MPRAKGTSGSKASLLFKMVDLIKANPGITVDGLAAELGRSRRTVFRYITALSADVNTPIYYDKGGYHLMPGSLLYPLNLTVEEASAVRAALESTIMKSGTPLGEAAANSLLKIQAALKEDDAAKLREVNGRFSIYTKVGTDNVEANENWLVLHNGVRNRHRLRILYRSQRSKQEKYILLDPYALTFRRHSWYCIGYSHEHEQIIQLRPVRMLKVEDTGEVFKPPKDFSVENYYAKSWELWTGEEEVTVKIRFSPSVADIIAETKRHPTQVTEYQPDGSVIFTCQVSGIEEISRWILGYGPEAEVIEPPELRAKIAEAANSLIKIYYPDRYNNNNNQ